MQRFRPNGDFCLELLILKKEGRLHFPLSAIVFEILISQNLQFDLYVDLCSILTVAAMFFWSSVMSDTIFNLDSLKIIRVKFGYNPFGSFRGEDLRKSLRRRTPNDSNSSLGSSTQKS